MKASDLINQSKKKQSRTINPSNYKDENINKVKINTSLDEEGKFYKYNIL